MSCPSRVEVDDRLRWPPPLPASRAECCGKPARSPSSAQLAIGGSERQVLNIRQGIDKSRFDVHLDVSTFRRADREDLTGTPLEVYKIWKCTASARSGALRLRPTCGNHRIDIVHAYNFYANVFALPAARLAHVPVVLASIRDTGEIWTARQRAVNKLVCRFMDRVVVNAEAIKRVLVADGYRPERIIGFPTGSSARRCATVTTEIRTRSLGCLQTIC